MHKTLVSTETLARHLDDPKWVVFDCRFDVTRPEAGREGYLKKHIPGAIYADLTACNNYTGGGDAFAQLDGDCPVLFLCGQRDRMAPAKLAQKYADANAAANIVLLPDCGHSLLSEAPHAVLRELKLFIDRHRGA